MKARTKALIVVLMVALALFTTAVYAAVPAGPNSIVESESEWATFGADPYQINAEAGNMTEMIIDGNKSTNYWQGYFGNITGSTVLADADNNTMYNWNMSDPTGEVYAANFTVEWASIMCVNMTQTDDYVEEHAMNLSILETYFNVPFTDADGIDETFNETYSDATGFQVGDVTINVDDNCPALYTFVDGAYQTASFVEVLLTDNVSAVVYTTVVEQDVAGFDGAPRDFQMMVNEYGLDEEPTLYYFYVDLA
ncbi:MAG: hypothetical protein GY861_27080 [bacterium]|nr:hypothetical protein [bacterium]